MDEVTQRWVRNKSDELAVANGCIFDEARGQDVCDWIERHCSLYEGRRGPMTLGDWQREATMRMFGWIRWKENLPSGGEPRWCRRFTRASIWISKKNAKTPTAAGWALYLLAGDGEPGQHVFFGAADGTQARLAAKHALEMVKASPELDADQGGEITINLTEMKLTHGPSRSDAKPISSGDKSAAKSKQGVNGSVIIDETHVVTQAFISESSIDKAGASRDEPLHIEVSTAGKDPDGYGHKQYLYGKQVESGEVEDQAFFFLCYEAPAELTDEELDADPVKYGKMANPTWGRIIQEEEFLSDYNRSKRSMADLADFKTFRLNIWQNSATPWIRVEDWRACKVEFSERDLEGRICSAGLDLAITRDMSALAFCFPWEDERFRLLCYFFMPEIAIKRLATKVPRIMEWVRDGHIIQTGGDTTDYRVIREMFREKANLFSVQELIFDAYAAEQVTQEMQEDTGVVRLKLPQSAGRLNEATQNFERAVLNRKMEHNGCPVLTWQMGHVNIHTDRNRNQMPTKPEREDHRKVDGVLSSVMAFGSARLTNNDENWVSTWRDRD